MSINCMKCGKPERQQPYGLCGECSKPYLLIDELKGLIPNHDGRNRMGVILQAVIDSAYDTGFGDGVTCYALKKDGTSYVGTTGRTLVDAILYRKQSHSYSPRI